MNPADFTIDFIGVGPQKTGTTWLYQQLKGHPQVCMPYQVKETQFFDRFYQRGIAEYAQYFDHRSPDQYCGDITPGYFDEPDVPARIAQHFPDAKLIITLRNPVDRAESHFRHHCRKGRIAQDFSRAVEQMPRIIEAGHYQQHLRRWFDHFPTEQVKIILTDDIAAEPQTVIRDVLDFLRLEAAPLPEQIHQRVNETGMARFPWAAKYAARTVDALRNKRLHWVVEAGKSLGLKKIYGGSNVLPSMTEEEKKRVLGCYQEDICFVEQLLGRELLHWKHTTV